MFRPRFIALTLLVNFAVSSAFGQGFILPRDNDKLMSRVQQYWDALKANKRNAAVQLVLSEDRDTFLNGSLDSIIKDIQFTALEFTGDRNKARVRVTVTQLPAGSPDFLRNSFADLWVWRDNNWYLHIESREEKDAALAKVEDADVKKYKKEFEDSLALEREVFDAGSLLRGGIRTVSIPLKYTGKWDVSVETVPPVTFIHTRERNIAAPVRSFPLHVDTDKAPDEFSVPVRLRFWSGVAIVEKTLTVKGKIFSPLSFRGPSGALVPGKPASVFVQNNTDETAEVMYYTTNEDFNLVASPMEIPPHKEAEVVLEILPDRKPAHLGLVLRKPLSGLSQFTYTFTAAP